jgi:hypothetical protein
LPPEPIHPDARCFHYFSPLGARHRFERAAERRVAARFHFEERDQVSAPRNEIELDSPHAEAVGDKLPTAALQKPDRLLFTGEAPLMSRVAPIRWITMNAARHSDKLRALPVGQ